MSCSLYQASIPAFQRTLTATTRILAKAQAHCAARKIDPRALLDARLFPDMFPFSRQVQLVTDFAKGGAARLAGVEVPRYEDVEATFAELEARLAKTLAFVESVDRAAVEAGAERKIMLSIAGAPTEFTGATMLTHYTLPNLYFHAATAYGILRHGGIELGKRDFMGLS
jgi:hypothetical protein